jgi:hypothetical protein
MVRRFPPGPPRFSALFRDVSRLSGRSYRFRPSPPGRPSLGPRATRVLASSTLGFPHVRGRSNRLIQDPLSNSDVVNSSSRAAPEQNVSIQIYLLMITCAFLSPWSPREVHYYPPVAIPDGSSRAVPPDKKTTGHELRSLPSMTAFPAPIPLPKHFPCRRRERLLPGRPGS